MTTNSFKCNQTISNTFSCMPKREWQSFSTCLRCSFCWHIDKSTMSQREPICWVSSTWKFSTTDLLSAFSLSSLPVTNHLRVRCFVTDEKDLLIITEGKAKYLSFEKATHYPEGLSPSYPAKCKLDESKHFLFHQKILNVIIIYKT